MVDVLPGIRKADPMSADVDRFCVTIDASPTGAWRDRFALRRERPVPNALARRMSSATSSALAGLATPRGRRR